MIRPLVARGARVWDIGANVGVFAFAAAHVAGPAGEVVAVEPDLFLAALLQRSALLAGNRDLAVSVVCAAVSETPGLALLCVASRGRSSNALAQVGHRSQAGGTRYVQHSATLTLDGREIDDCCWNTLAVPRESDLTNRGI